jgi:hypothetical protein
MLSRLYEDTGSFSTTNSKTSLSADRTLKDH